MSFFPFSSSFFSLIPLVHHLCRHFSVSLFVPLIVLCPRLSSLFSALCAFFLLSLCHPYPSFPPGFFLILLISFPLSSLFSFLPALILTFLHPTLFQNSPHFLIFLLSSIWGHQSSLCSPYDIIQCRLQPVRATVQMLVALDTTSLDRKQEEAISATNPAPYAGSGTPLLVSVTTQTPPPAWQIWELIGSSLLHILCLVLLFMAYSWSELR